ncbi:aspartate kinase [Ancylobacter oerskovii]|uniref:Aspartate kinase n=1 Tax=Ancylobacter oerskovii TaxID=459519 RepID=A0ABW4YXI0_9HYPH|nr:aspartate kinase [Ancylobacter oerskovii]MBS7541962.1 aspartate kinase [Ancylobacter oerskovii]
MHQTPLPEAVIVKLGGSLAAAPGLAGLLARLAETGAPLVVVPGGGPLADAVRDLQPRLSLSDRACHHMAILAMESFALALGDLEPRLLPCTDAAAMARAHAAGRAALWLPAEMGRAADLPASWNVTSDSLALWLALHLGARRLAFVKSAPSHGTAPGEWAAAGLVDPFVPTLAARYAGRLELLSVEEALAAFPCNRSAA